MRIIFISSIVLGTLLLNLIIAGLTSRMAKERGYDARLGFICGLIMGVLAPLIILALPARGTAPATPVEDLIRCPRCRRETRQYEGFCTECGAKLHD